jgi:hypothetical protein
MGLDIIVLNKNKKEIGYFRVGSYGYFHEFRGWLFSIVKDLKVGHLFFYFFNHSDSSGNLNYNKCKKLLKGFESDEFKQEIFFQHLEDNINKYFFESVNDWIGGLKLVVKNKGSLLFC